MPFPLHQRLLSPGHRYERVPVRKGCQRQETVETQASLWTGEVLTDQGSEGTSFGHILERLLIDSMRCRPGDINRRLP